MSQIEEKAKKLAIFELNGMYEEMSLIKPTSWRYKELKTASEWLSDFIKGIKNPAPNLAAKLAAHRIAQGV